MSNSGRGAVAGALSLVLLICFLSVRVQAKEKPDSRREARNPTRGISDQRAELAPNQLRDYWVTAGEFDIGQTYQNLSLPEGFFGDNCEAFEGPVRYKGVPLDHDNLGRIDTILQRSADPVRLRDPVETVGTVDLTLTELSLVSIGPITVMCSDGAQTFDIHVGLSPESAPTGWLTATKKHSNGGTFDSLIILYPLLTFTNVENTEDVYVLDTADTAEPVELTGRRIPFVHDPGDGVRAAYQDKRFETEIVGNPTRQFYPGFGYPVDGQADGKQTGDGVRLPGRISWVDPPLPPPPRGALHIQPGHSHFVNPDIGACCETDGTCTQKSGWDCWSSDGTYMGAAVPCNPNPCEVECQAGCTEDEDCYFLFEENAEGNLELIEIGCDPAPAPAKGGKCKAKKQHVRDPGPPVTWDTVFMCVDNGCKATAQICRLEVSQTGAQFKHKCPCIVGGPGTAIGLCEDRVTVHSGGSPIDVECIDSTCAPAGDCNAISSENPVRLQCPCDIP